MDFSVPPCLPPGGGWAGGTDCTALAFKTVLKTSVSLLIYANWSHGLKIYTGGLSTLVDTLNSSLHPKPCIFPLLFIFPSILTYPYI